MGRRRTDIIGVTDATGVDFKSSTTTVTEAATLIPATNIANRKAITVFNNDANNTVYLGGSDVTTANGFPLKPSQSFSFDLGSGGQLYGICDSGKTADCRAIQIDNS